MENPIIVALDNIETVEQLDRLVSELAPHVGMFKAGLELIHWLGTPFIIDFVHRRGGKLFLDCKLDDIPNTVKKTSQRIVQQGVAMFNVMANAGDEAVAAAAEVARKSNSRLLVVTVLTSLDFKRLWKIGHVSALSKIILQAGETESHQIGTLLARADAMDKRYVPQVVLAMATMAADAKAHGIISSPKELQMLGNDEHTSSLLKVTPGIRLPIPRLTTRSARQPRTKPSQPAPITW